MEKTGTHINALTVALFAAILFIPFLGDVHLFDWDEINFAESAREMLITKEYFRVQINFQPFWEKPPLFFWLQAGCMKIFGVNEFAARLPNAFCGIVTLTTLFSIARRHFSLSVAIWWVLFMTASFTPHLYFKSGIIDPWFNYFIFITIYQLYQATTVDEPDFKAKRFIYAGIFCGLAVITKGPVALLIVGLCSGTWIVMNRFRFFFSLRLLMLGLIPFLLISSLWVAAEVSKNGVSVLYDFLAYQVDLFKNPVAGHGQPFWYHPLVLLLGCFPASIFAFKGFFTPAEKHNAEQRYLRRWMAILFWVVLILFSIVKTKIVHYSSLCYIPLTFMAALGTDAQVKSLKRFNNATIIAVLIMGSIISALLLILPLVDQFKQSVIPYIKDDFAVASLSVTGSWSGFEFIIGLIFLLLVIFSCLMLWQNRGAMPVYALLLTFSVLIPAYLEFVVPKIEDYSQGPAIAFYQQLADKDVYVETLGHKSYAQYFYTRSTPKANPNYKNLEWLKNGPIDKPAYFVVKVNDVHDYDDLHLKEVARKGGFALLLREPPVHPSAAQ